MKKTMLVMAMAIALVMSTMAGAFADAHFGITSPSAPDGERALIAPGDDVLLEAVGPTDVPVSWAVRTGTCDRAQPTDITIAGNVDGRSDEASYAGGQFSFTLASGRISETNGDEFYCFVFNPVPGDNDTRYTQEFVVVSSETTKDICKDGGWRNWAEPTFRNQGACVSYFQANPNAAFDTFNS